MRNNLAELPEDSVIQCKPFLKWAGGKSQLLHELIKRSPKSFNRYFEPFLGGGAMYFALQPKEAVLFDINSDLINTYMVVRDSVEELIDKLSVHVYESDYYYKVRDMDRDPSFARIDAITKAARFIYLNKTCFNGLYRVNSRGEFNVPFGRYVNPKICDAGNLRACSEALRGASIVNSSFKSVLDDAKKEDFVYFDPPYVPLNPTSSFTSYSREGFGHDSQVCLRDVCVELDRKGVRFMLSNSSTPIVRDLYRQFNVSRVDANRAINSKGSSRGKVEEVIVTNY